jgi:hypothetical protein
MLIKGVLNKTRVGMFLKEVVVVKQKLNKTPWLWSASELYLPSDRRLLAKLVPNFADNYVDYYVILL